jgi:hypothetical protein
VLNRLYELFRADLRSLLKALAADAAATQPDGTARAVGRNRLGSAAGLGAGGCGFGSDPG